MKIDCIYLYSSFDKNFSVKFKILLEYKSNILKKTLSNIKMFIFKLFSESFQIRAVEC